MRIGAVVYYGQRLSVLECDDERNKYDRMHKNQREYIAYSNCGMEYDSVVRQYRLKISIVNDALIRIGKDTLAIYIVSSYINSLILPRLTASLKGSYLLNLAETAGIVIFCMLFAYICRKIPKVNGILFGGR